MATEEKRILFEEEQRFRQVWLWVLIGAVALLFWTGFIWQVLFDKEFGDNPISNIELALVTALSGVGLPYFFYMMKLRTRVYPDELQVRFYPIHLNWVKISLKQVKHVEAVTYSPITDYGGWGIRWGLKGKAYNMSGDQGVKLYFYNKKRTLLIGTQRPEELEDVLEKVIDELDKRV